MCIELHIYIIQLVVFAHGPALYPKPCLVLSKSVIRRPVLFLDRVVLPENMPVSTLKEKLIYMRFRLG
jgi:hypothetical protein